MAAALCTLFLGAQAIPSRSAPEPAMVTPWVSGPALPLARGGAASGWVHGRFVVAGGSYWQEGVKRWTDRVDAYDPTTRRWEALPPMPAPVADAGYASNEAGLNIVGGAAEGRATARCLSLTKTPSDGWRWQELPPLPHARGYATAVLADGRLWAMGGCDDPADLRSASRECFELSLESGKKWRAVAPLPPPGRCLAAGAARGRDPLVFGGCYGNEAGKAVNLSQALRYDRGRKQWRPVAALPYPVRAAVAVRVDKDRTAIIGGYSGGPDDMERYGAAYGFERRLLFFDGKHFSQGASLPATLAAPSVATNAGMVYLTGGEDRARSRNAAFSSATTDALRRDVTSRPVWVCLGDSVTHGVGRSGVSGEETYPRRLERSLSGSLGAPWVLNGGVGGENTRQAIARLPSLLKPLVRVDRIVIMYGLNDAALIDGGPRDRTEPRVPVNEYAENLRALVREARRQGAAPVLCTPNPMTRAYPYANRGQYATNKDINFKLREYVAACRRVAGDEKVPLVDVFSLFEKRKGWEALLPDGIHPNAEGLAIAAEAVQKSVVGKP